jgi:hypothetical protein
LLGLELDRSDVDSKTGFVPTVDPVSFHAVVARLLMQGDVGLGSGVG